MHFMQAFCHDSVRAIKDGFEVDHGWILGRVVPGQGIVFMSYDTISRFVSSLVEK